MGCGLPGSSFPGILQAGILEWVAISFSRRSSQPRDRNWVSCMQADTLPSELPSKDPMHVLLHSVPPALHQATTQPCLCWRPPDTQSKSRTVSCGALLLSPGSWCTKFCCGLQESISQSCVSSGSSMVGLMMTSSKRVCAICRSAAPRAPVPAQTTADP